MDEKQRYDAGLQVRKAVLGEAHVERSLAARTDFTSEFQEFITRTAWGTVWTRDGLPRHTRSLLTLAMMVALGHDEEFKLHVRAARNNGVTADEIKEVLLQAAIYCGVPAANHAFALAGPILEEQSADTP
ncbi:4-carboxymuconolactone decarboxylase [Xanthomonas hyacinthi]|uniref:4-carboxymuconolactone decarboxylase n=1 Tax=Xanthomonas hyacinthi TaxID=56455 RepID=A0A2S7F3H6_9XANT|nr:4-carboxymuconolactone decarboxylase [Xanthomonas hyacinthi]KLD75657.1 4-carboxymuconolactone decarboxylase [Xanthomonas hyacinthi DSM 19077]PPU99839.1 4-carboxymuconolactone decarboxylase [Xanthomonas hyacinthi]QGY76002.1 4-carboxymuconolactone decarboxylase [Xanthomonas hyacinthi]